jgi:hypothetical protein
MPFFSILDTPTVAMLLNPSRIFEVTMAFIIGNDRSGWTDTPCNRERSFLHVFDVPRAGAITPTVLIDIQGQESISAQFNSELQALPTQDPGNCRFYVDENAMNVGGFNTHVTEILRAIDTENDVLSRASPSFARLKSQWNSPTSSLRWISTSYDLDGTPPHRVMIDPSKSLLWFLASLTRSSKKICVVEDRRGCILGK